VVGEQEAQRRLRQRIEILGRQLAVPPTTWVPSAMMSIGLGGSYSNRTLPGFWMNRWPVVRRPSGPICTKLPVSTCTLVK